MFYILDKEHNPIKTDDIFLVNEWMEDFGKRFVKKTTVASDVEVSTVFLCTDYNFSGEGKPIVFETMIFGGERDLETFRYSTWDEALNGHDKIVEEFKQRCPYCTALRIKDNICCTQCGSLF